MNKRLTYIDNAKAILIFMVVFAHILNYANPQYGIMPYTLTQAFITSFHMPAFFLITGMLFKNEKWREQSWGAFLISRLRSLMIPYLFFETIAILYLHFVLHSVTLTEGLWKMLTFRCNVGADWFLPAMFLANVFYFVAVKYPNRYVWPFIAVACFFCTWILPGGHWWAVLCRGLLGFGFIFLGNWTKKWLTADKPTYAVAAFFLTAVFSALSLKYYSNDFFECVVENPPLFAACGLTGLYFVLSVSRRIHWRWLRLIGENTLPIMGTHQLVLYTVPSSNSPVWVIGMILLIAAVELVFVFLTNKTCPLLIGKKKRNA